ncbi:hypothetical protein N7465_006951 [Penicillium sp. CMV-2018d]|nr:hypothetical protein N7465_006951 [Penicillium sp. CMV-2018d]
MASKTCHRARTSTLGQESLSSGDNLNDSTSASKGSKTTTQSSCPPFLGESHDIIVPPDARILRPRSLEDIDYVIKQLKAEFDRHTLDTHTPRPSQYIWVHKIPQRLFAQIETDLELFPGVRVTVAHAESSLSKETPHKLIFGFDLRMPWNLFYNTFATQDLSSRQDATECLKYASSPLSIGRGYNISINDAISRKLGQRYAGLFTVVERVGHLAYKLQLPPT